MKARNATPIEPCTASTRAFSVAGRFDPNSAAAAPNSDRISTHSSSDPSWLPQTPDTLYSIGFSVCEFGRTTASEKSDTTKAQVSAAKDTATSRNCAIAAGAAIAINAGRRRRCAPHSGKVDLHQRHHQRQHQREMPKSRQSSASPVSVRQSMRHRPPLPMTLRRYPPRPWVAICRAALGRPIVPLPPAVSPATPEQSEGGPRCPRPS